MERFINNVMELGFSGLLLWFVFILLVHWLVNKGFRGIETMMKMKHTIYMYDVIWLLLLVVAFLYGIFCYKS